MPISSFYREKTYEGLRNWLNVMKLGICRVKTRTQVVWIQSLGKMREERLEGEPWSHATIPWGWRGLESGGRGLVNQWEEYERGSEGSVGLCGEEARWEAEGKGTHEVAGGVPQGLWGWRR